MSFILNYEVFLEGSVILWKEKEGKHFIYLSSLRFYYEGDYTEDPNTADCSLESNNFKNRICQAYLSYYKKKMPPIIFQEFEVAVDLNILLYLKDKMSELPLL